ncbi:protein TIFY 10A-like [Impatiens glandulifera]|uniref:protein TIFY 10A-like n=1 Tax=Impatiens glandulifera TaxID=253017 RepID=UPI001FB0AFC9|nr:protein TIFY 10A-like [Impatiens glandulifera]
MSTSSDFADSGRYFGKKPAKSPEKSKVSQTCNLLSKYLKENGSLGDLGIGIMRCPPAIEKLPTTMNLFPMAGDSNLSDEKKLESETAPMTIFYGEKVMVFNDFSTEKFNEIMALVSKENSQYQRINNFSSRPSTPVQITAVDPNSNDNLLPRRLPHRVVADLSMARKTSLTRFFEKRKDRIIARAPYSINKPTISPSDATNAKGWLGLGP